MMKSSRMVYLAGKYVSSLVGSCTAAACRLAATELSVGQRDTLSCSPRRVLWRLLVRLALFAPRILEQDHRLFPPL